MCSTVQSRFCFCVSACVDGCLIAQFYLKASGPATAQHPLQRNMMLRSLSLVWHLLQRCCFWSLGHQRDLSHCLFLPLRIHQDPSLAVLLMKLCKTHVAYTHAKTFSALLPMILSVRLPLIRQDAKCTLNNHPCLGQVIVVDSAALREVCAREWPQDTL